jgi:xanthine dehydrogenase accessory factor
MSSSLLEQAYQLTQAGEAFVLATVIWCEKPTSAKPGAQMLIRRDGTWTGWIGGSCVQPIVLREAQHLLQDGGAPYVLQLGSSERGERSGIKVFPMLCSSGGVMNLYIEPHLPQPRLVLIGASPVIGSLAQLAPVLDFAVTQLDQTDLSQAELNEQTYVLVASHGQYDEEVLAQVLVSPVRYIGMVASRRRAEACRDVLREMGLTEAQVARLKAPAGLDIGAITPEEIAASILAEVVQVQRRGPLPSQPKASDGEVSPDERATHPDEIALEQELTAIDPVCGMIVTRATTRHHSVYANHDVYFCCAACQRQFEHDPQAYLAQHAIIGEHT